MRRAVTLSGQIVGFALWKSYTDLARNASAIGQDGTESGTKGMRKVQGEGMRVGRKRRANGPKALMCISARLILG